MNQTESLIESEVFPFSRTSLLKLECLSKHGSIKVMAWSALTKAIKMTSQQLYLNEPEPEPESEPESEPVQHLYIALWLTPTIDNGNDRV